MLAIHYGVKEPIGWIPRLSSKTIEKFFIEITGKQGVFLCALYLDTAIVGGIIEALRINQQKERIIKWKFIITLYCFFFQ